MSKGLLLLVTGSALLVPLSAQTVQQNAIVRGGGNGREGSCTVELLVDGVAEVEIRGANGQVRNLGGGAPQWRRFECTGVLPPNPADFRFQPMNGHGRQNLVRDPRQGGVAVVRIEDQQGGAGEYRFSIAWGGGDNYSSRGGDFRRDGDSRRDDGFRRDGGPPPAVDRDGDRWHDERRGFGRGDEWRRRIFERVRQDLEHVQSETFPVGGDQYRLGQARRELDELQNKLVAGRYDERELDDVIRALRNVVRDNRLAPRDRDVLSDDLDRLRDFRARHESYGAR
jgi:hypothetical protein